MNTELEYHEQLTVRLDACFRRGIKPADEDQAAAISAVYAIARDGLSDSEDARRLNWLEGECRAGRVQLLINHVHRGVGNTVRAAIDAAMRSNACVSHAGADGSK